MKWIVALICTLCVFQTAVSLRIRRVPFIDFYEEAKQEDLSAEELQILKPIIDDVNFQYQKIAEAPIEDVDIETETKIRDLCLSILENASGDNDDYRPFSYDLTLPSLSEFRGSFMADVPSEEIRDMEKILQETIDEAQTTVVDIAQQANELEARLISINKIKILKFIGKMLQSLFSLGSRVARTAYCTYSHVPLINSTLTDGKTNIGLCYSQTKNAIKDLRTSIQSSITTIRQSLQDVIKIYKKIANRESLLGKLLTLLMNVTKLQSDIKKSREAAYKTIDTVQNDVPVAIAATKECTTTTVPTFVHELNATVTSLTTCYNYVDDSTWGPEPEPESEESQESDILIK